MTFLTLRAVAAPASVALLAGLLLAPMPAAADETGDGLVQMQEFPAAEFTAEAAELPAELVEALARDVQISPEEYLAQSAAAVLAVEVVDDLESAGVGVLSSRLDGTDLIVNVQTETDAAIVESVGATAEFGEPAPLWDPASVTPEFLANIYGGQGYIYDGPDGQYQCSLGFNGVALPSNTPQIATAGHCTLDMIGSPEILNQTAPGQTGTLGVTLGAKVASTTFLGSGRDIGRIGANGHTLVRSVAGWGGSTGAPLSTTRSVTGDAQPVMGSQICKSGSRTGWTCGPVVDVDYVANVCVEGCEVGGTPVIQTVNSFVAQICSRPGDSGGAALIGSKALGITSWGTTGGGGCTSDTYAGYFQMISPGGDESVASQYSGTWELSAQVAAPVVTSPNGVSNTTLSGTVANAGANYFVDVYIDGSSSIFATAAVNSGAWSVNVSALPTGIHSFSAVARYGTKSLSTPTAGFVKRGMTVDRISASTRYTMGIEIAQEAYPSGNAPVVYVTNGLGYADALSAGPAAALQGGVMLLTKPTELPAEVATEIERLNPAKIVVVGGVASVSDAVFAQLEDLQPNIERLGGANRYEASRNIVADAFVGENPSTAYISTGLNFPDALGASAAGGAFGYPVILVKGTDGTIDAATMQLLDDLNVETVKIAGGPASVSDSIFNAIEDVYGASDTIRLSGANRYEASANIALDAFGSSSPDLAYFATGQNFPDALAGGPLAAMSGSPLLSVRQACVPGETLGALRTLGVTDVTLLGGTASLASTVQSLNYC